MIGLVTFAITVLLVPIAQSVAAECLNVASGSEAVSLHGKIRLEVFPGPPNYESVERGDAPEPTWLLLLDRPMCADDGGEFTDPTKMFDSVHVYSSEKHVQSRLKSREGKRVMIRGSAFAAQTGHHHAPLVVDVKEISKN